jgi:hypothetical protein
MNLRGRVGVYWVAAFGIAAALAPRSVLAQAGCCVCTSCAAPALFACREALDDPQCQTTCTNLGCSTHQFNIGTECADTPQCYGDCCDVPDAGCGQAHQADCTDGSVFFANSFCDGSNCVAAPPTATATATDTATPTATITATPSHSPTATASATVTHTPVATPTASLTPTRSAAASPTTTPTPVNSPTPSATPMQGQLTWLFDGRKRTNNIGSPLAGFTFVFPRQGKKPSLDLEDSASRFCTQPGLTPRVHLDLDPADCENQCTIGVFPQDSTAVTHIAHLPALHRAAGTFDVLIDTVLGCEGGQPPTQLRMPAAVTYANCIGDCNGDGAVDVGELVLAVGIALDQNETSDCLVDDRDASGSVEIDELIAAVKVALEGCGD